MRALLLTLLTALTAAPQATPETELPSTPAVTFGTTVVRSSGLRGDIYLLKPGTDQLPNLKKLKPVGSIFTAALEILPRPFLAGFPGITDRFEWFAIQYEGKFWIESPGVYRFRLLSDDGAKLFINNQELIDNDGLHPPQLLEASAEFTRGVHEIRLPYFQGPKDMVALVLWVMGPGEPGWRVFSTDTFLPPEDSAAWVPGKISNRKRSANW